MKQTKQNPDLAGTTINVQVSAEILVSYDVPKGRVLIGAMCEAAEKAERKLGQEVTGFQHHPDLKRSQIHFVDVCGAVVGLFKDGPDPIVK